MREPADLDEARRRQLERGRLERVHARRGVIPRQLLDAGHELREPNEALNVRGRCPRLGAGELAAASANIDEAHAIIAATGGAPLPYGSPVLAAYRGLEAEALRRIEAGADDARVRGEGRALAVADYARAVLYNGLARYRDAQTAAERACCHDDLGLLAWSLFELVEAGARSGDRDAAVGAARRLEERTRAAGTASALGIQAAACALVSDGDAADAHYRDAIERLSHTPVPVHAARAHLLYGEWLRRRQRRVDAREQLRAAYERFVEMGAQAFAERARGELLATGETVRRLAPETREALTPQEAQIARLAGSGQTNPEIGGQLFISSRTVEYHLHKVFTKLGVSSRKELRAALSAGASADVPPTAVRPPSRSASAR